MATLYLRKLYQSFVPCDSATVEAMEKLNPNAEIKCEISTPRNLGLHRKFFGLLDIAFDAWEAPELKHKGVAVAKNRERFRKDIAILCGHYETVVNIKGELRLEAKSISFASMSQDDFEVLYSTAIDVILKNVLGNYKKDDLDRVTAEILGFC